MTSPQQPPVQPGLNPGVAPDGSEWGSRMYPPERGRNGFSVAGLVLGIVPVMGGILGIIFGLIGRGQAKQRGQKGRVMGTWGAALGALWLAIIVTAVVVDQTDDAERGNDGQVVKPGEESAFTLRVGDCLRALPSESDDVDEVDLIACTRAHRGEVFANIRLTFSTYPGDETVSKRAESVCVAAFKPFVGKAYNDSELDLLFLRPSLKSWRVGDRTTTCIISGDRLVGTAKGSRR